MITHKGTRTIETERLTLRRYTAGDARAMLDNWAGDPEVTKFLTWPPHSDISVSRAVLDDWVKRYEKPDYYQWAIVPKELGEPVGDIAVVEQNDKPGVAQIGYALGKPWWHKGLMSEALSAVIDYLFGEVGFNRIEARHDPNNPRSGAVMRKCGMIYEGTRRQADFNNQGISDACVYSILRGELASKAAGNAPKLIIVRGNSGSGKTTLAYALQEKFGSNTMLISHDMIRMNILHTRGHEGVEKSLPLMTELLRYGKRHSNITILEGILDSKGYSPLFEAAKAEFGPNILAYYYDIPFEETLKRHQTKPNRADFGESDMRRWWLEKDYIGLIPEKTFGADVTLERAVEIVGEDVARS